MVKVRFAPSPTGDPHLGGIRTALYNFLFARHNKGEFLLRIEDTDQKRLVNGAEETILKTLNWLGLDFDEEVIHQSDRLDIYKKHVQTLLDKKIAYEKDNAVWTKMPVDKTFSWTDLVGNKKISFLGKDQQDFVILKSDGFPTYHLANVVDDHLMEITHVIRGEEWISSVPKHLYLYESFGWTAPNFAHLPVILGPDKGKLSKRHDAKSILDYGQEGFLKETLLNFIALLGWNPGGDREILSIKEMIEAFDLKDINTANPKFDSKKLEWMNGEYIHRMKSSVLARDILGKFPEFSKIPEKEFESFVNLAKTRMQTLSDFKEFIDPFFAKNKIELDSREKEIAVKLLEELQDVQNWEEDKILEAIKKVVREQEIKMQLIYKIVTGKEKGLPLSQVFSILGKEQIISIINKALENE